MTLRELANRLAAQEISSRQLIEEALAAIKDPRGEGARVFLAVHENEALAAADRVDALRRSGVNPGGLSGIPISIKDLFDEAGVDVCYELHPGEDLHDGVTFERFLKAVNDHKRANILYDPSHMILQQLDYLEFIDFYHDRIRAFHVKDAEFRPNGKAGVYGGYQAWIDRPGRFRSLGDGQIDFRAIFSKMAQYDYPGWAVLEWECCIKSPKVGAAEGANLIKQWVIKVTEKAFDDFAGSGADAEKNRKVLGLGAQGEAAAD